MHQTEDILAHEVLMRELMDPERRKEYATPYDTYRPGWVARFLAWVLVTSGNLAFGYVPSYRKFKAIEIIARIPYQSWEAASYTLLTLFHRDEKYALSLAQTARWSRMAQDNETLHVVIISNLVHKLGNEGFFKDMLLPILFSFAYSITVYVLYLLHPRSALELNYLFENHAFAQYQEFLDRNAVVLQGRPVVSEFLAWYGREVRNEYELFETIRNDELIHRNRSIREIQARSA